MTTDCLERSDRMVAVARGDAAWSDDDRLHLDRCPDCATEWRLVQTASRLGRRVDLSLDPDRIGARVLAGLKQPAPPVRILPLRRWTRLALPLAAAAAIALVVWPGDRGGGDESPAATIVGAELLPEMQSLDADQLEAVLEMLPVTASATPDIRALEDLTEDEWSNLLRTLGG